MILIDIMSRISNLFKRCRLIGLFLDVATDKMRRCIAIVLPVE